MPKVGVQLLLADITVDTNPCIQKKRGQEGNTKHNVHHGCPNILNREPFHRKIYTKTYVKHIDYDYIYIYLDT